MVGIKRLDYYIKPSKLTHRNISLSSSELMCLATITRLKRLAGISGLGSCDLVHAPARLLPVHRLVGALDLVPTSQQRALWNSEVLQHHT